MSSRSSSPRPFTTWQRTEGTEEEGEGGAGRAEESVRDARECGTPKETNEAPIVSSSRIVNLTFHAVVWASCLVLAALAPALVRAYAAHLERRTRTNADALMARLLSSRASSRPTEEPGSAGRAT